MHCILHYYLHTLWNFFFFTKDAWNTNSTLPVLMEDNEILMSKEGVGLVCQSEGGEAEKAVCVGDTRGGRGEIGMNLWPMYFNAK